MSIKIDIQLSREYDDAWKANHTNKFRAVRCKSAHEAVSIVTDLVAEYKQIPLDEIVTTVFINGKQYTGNFKDL